MTSPAKMSRLKRLLCRVFGHRRYRSSAKMSREELARLQIALHECDELKREVERLKKFEWGGGFGGGKCPCCEAIEAADHEEECALGDAVALLEELAKPKDGE